MEERKEEEEETSYSNRPVITYNSLQSSQPTYLRELFTIQPTRSTRSSSSLTLSRPPVTSHLMFSNRAISIKQNYVHWGTISSTQTYIRNLYYLISLSER